MPPFAELGRARGARLLLRGQALPRRRPGGNSRTIPIVAMTARGDRDKEAFLHAGFTDYIMGGTYEQVVNTIKTMCSNLTGMMCDGAKQGCALKVYSGVSAAVLSALVINLKCRNIDHNVRFCLPCGLY